MTDFHVITSRLRKLWDLPLSAEEQSLRCPRCGAEMESVGGGVGCIGLSWYAVVPPILVIKCPQCGYEERSWA
jgi:predicted RNA-binding Zn-ribbon protein involved in translation (DUF1610 family)